MFSQAIGLPVFNYVSQLPSVQSLSQGLKHDLPNVIFGRDKMFGRIEDGAKRTAGQVLGSEVYIFSPDALNADGKVLNIFA